jgi:hypothetical protein
MNIRTEVKECSLFVGSKKIQGHILKNAEEEVQVLHSGCGFLGYDTM